MSTKVEVRIGNKEDVICTGTLFAGGAPFMFWNAVVVDPLTDTDTVVGRLQSYHTNWEAYRLKTGEWVLLLPPIFQINKIETVL